MRGALLSPTLGPHLTDSVTVCSEEQHDDQVLHELLRCFKALTMTAVRRLHS